MADDSAAPPPVSAPQSPTRDDEWQFLFPWMDVLGLLSHDREDAADVHVKGGDDDTFWLSVALEREDVLMQHAGGERAALREIHEAIVLTHLMAQVRPEIWVQWFVVEERCYLAPWFIPGTHRLRFQYAFVFNQPEHGDDAFLSWENSMDALLGGVEPSDAFLRDLPRVQDLLQRHGVRWNDLEPIPILLHAKTSAHRSHVMLTRIASLVEATRAVEEVIGRADASESLRHSRGTLFRVAALELDLSGSVLTPRLFALIHDVLTLGVDVEYLSLPRSGTSNTNADDHVDMCGAGLFMRTLLGLSENEEGQVTRVRHLVMTDCYVDSSLFAPFCSALACARFLRVLHIKSRGDDDEDTSVELRRHMWSWLSFALFSSASTSSLEALVVDGIGIQPSDVNAVRAVVESDDPVATMCVLARERIDRSLTSHDISSMPRGGRPAVTLHLDETWTIRDGRFTNSFIGTRPFVAVGDLVLSQNNHETNEDGEGAGDTFYIPGLGFCDSKHTVSARSSKKMRLDPEPERPRLLSSLQTLVIRNGQSSTDDDEALHGLLDLIGSRLRSLHIQLPGIDETALDRVFAACPRLENFGLAYAYLSSMRVFVDAYDRYGLALSSLTLIGISVPESHFQRFLRMLLQHNKIESTLRRLELGSRWPYELSNATIAIVRNILDHNKTLTHVKSYISMEQCPWVREMMDTYHGKLVEGLSYTDRARQMATLGGLRHAAHANARLALNDDIRRLEVAFAAPTPIHRIATWCSCPIGVPPSDVQLLADY